MSRIFVPRWNAILWCFAAVFLTGCFEARLGLAQQINAPRSAPHDGYWACFGPYLEGDFRTAGKAFRDAARDGLMNWNLAAPGPWMDGVCYHAMAGECHYQMGELQQALDEFTAAARIYLAHRDWMLKIDLPAAVEPETNVKTPPAWGASSRATMLGRFKPRYPAFTGRIDNQDVVRRGGVLETPAYFPVYVSEIVRCTALAISRRRELLGPVSEHDPLTTQLVEALGRLPAPANHWSQCWVQLELGVAYAAANRVPQAIAELQKSLQAMGQYDHPLTCVALLELGRIAFEQGKYDAAKTYFHEATISAFFFERRDVLEEAFRLGAEAHLLAGGKGTYSPLAAAIGSLPRVQMVQASLAVSLVEQLISSRELPQAGAALAQARNAIGRREMASGVIGSRLNYQAARLAAHKGEARASATALATALTFQKTASKRLLHVAVADAAYRSGNVTERIADLIFNEALREPSHVDWLQAPLDTLALVSSHQPLAYEHWFEVALARKEYEKAINIAERIRRKRFFATQPLGGRLLGLRWALGGPPDGISQEANLQRQAMLAKYPKFDELSRWSAQVRSRLRELALAPTDAESIKKQQELLAELAKTSAAQESLLQLIALEREPCELAFPPLRDTKQLQERLPEGTAVLYYFATSRNLYAFALARDKYAQLELAQPAKIKSDVVEFLRQMGNQERTHVLTSDDLRSKAWQATGKRLMSELTGRSQGNEWNKFQELVVVPDGVLWYLPFESLPWPGDESYSTLLTRLPVRYAPLLSLAVDSRPAPRLERTAVVAGKLLARDDEAMVQAGIGSIVAAAEDAEILGRILPQPSAMFAATIDRLVVLADHEDSDKVPAGWAPLVFDAGKPSAALAEWLSLPLDGPQQMVLPGFHTAAENSLKRNGTGDEVFLTACNLMASGCRTALVSRWRVGGQSTMDLMREFVQELPHQPASAAWRRSVQLAGQRMIDPTLEGRVRANASEPIAADHPFFWSGYMLIDSGGRVLEE